MQAQRIEPSCGDQKFIESEDDKMVRKIALREIRMLKFVDHTVLDELERYPNGLDENTVRKIIHRDVKPENILVSKSGVVKLCDFGFAITLGEHYMITNHLLGPGEVYTDYVATRWYRAPELLVGDTKYGQSCRCVGSRLFISKMLTGEPLFPGDSDIDQLIISLPIGNLTSRHREIFHRNPLFVGMKLQKLKK
ncbi:Cyclin-dependent kinase-like 2 [Desmophyllum pertusum]|uniref:Cyclin-dependent kinase-like 2 n=1 Tax=Desmophyllum pertusum TaxID=174260 RepID=A0A9W9ZEH0_9CNID|nr:Cyclin-dependent kinase-like 2 [Desmophyllum pertusum]